MRKGHEIRSDVISSLVREMGQTRQKWRGIGEDVEVT